MGLYATVHDGPLLGGMNNILLKGEESLKVFLRPHRQLFV